MFDFRVLRLGRSKLPQKIYKLFWPQKTGRERANFQDKGSVNQFVNWLDLKICKKILIVKKIRETFEFIFRENMRWSDHKVMKIIEIWYNGLWLRNKVKKILSKYHWIHVWAPCVQQIRRMVSVIPFFVSCFV